MNHRKIDTGKLQNNPANPDSTRKITTTHASRCYCDECWDSRRQLMTELTVAELYSLHYLADVLHGAARSIQSPTSREIFSHLFGAMNDFQGAIQEEERRRKKRPAK